MSRGLVDVKSLQDQEETHDGHEETQSSQEVDQESWQEGFEEESWQEEEKVTPNCKLLALTDRSRPRRYESPRERAFVLWARMRRGFVAALALVALAGCAHARTLGGSSGRAALATEIVRLLTSPVLAGSGTALIVVSLDRGDTLFAREVDRLYTPGSNLKLFTATAALHTLGPDYRFRTSLLATGAIEADTLRGDLVLVGRGDPDLLAVDLAALADTLIMRGARVVLGDVRADASWFDVPADWGPGWMWDDGPFWFWPWISALTVEDNVVTLTARPGPASGRPVAIGLSPATSFVDVRVSATTGSPDADSTLEVTRQWMPRAANVIEVTGVLPLGADSIVEQRSVEDPPLYAATLLRELLAERGVEVRGDVRYGALAHDEVADTVAVHVSESLAVSIRNFLKASDNLTGEQLVKTIGAEVDGAPGSYASGLAAVRAFLEREVGLDSAAFVLADGSGVSRYNLVTAGQIARLLDYVYAREDLAAPFIAALPVAGVDGTLESRMRGTPAEGRVRAKTGSLQGVSTLSGYALTGDDERFAFSLLMEFFVGSTDSRRAVQDSVVARLARFRR